MLLGLTLLNESKQFRLEFCFLSIHLFFIEALVIGVRTLHENRDGTAFQSVALSEPQTNPQSIISMYSGAK